MSRDFELSSRPRDRASDFDVAQGRAHAPVLELLCPYPRKVANAPKINTTASDAFSHALSGLASTIAFSAGSQSAYR